MPLTQRLLLCGGMMLACTPPATAQAPAGPRQLTIHPAQVILTHADDRQRLLVTGTLTDGSVRDFSREVRFSSGDAAVATVSAEGIVAPNGNGRTAIEIVAGNTRVRVPVHIVSSAPRPVSFANDIMPLLARAGCNSGACHGSASGKKGFKVSLRGYDPESDYVTLTRDTIGRRLNLLDPERSLLFLKPTTRVPHEGGLRFSADSPYAQILKRWITEGATSDLAAAPKLVGLEVTPAFRSFTGSGQEQQLLVSARFSDGSRRDITADARYSSSNENVGFVNDDGLVKLPRKGETAVMVRYGPRIAVANFVVLERNPGFAWSNPPETNYVDRLVNDKLKKMESLPAELTTDQEFLRRVYYDVIGLPPTPAEVRAFLADQRADKRARAIDALLLRSEHADYWALKWGDLFKLRFDLLRDHGTWGMYRWLRDAIAANKPYDRFVRDIITAQGSCAENPPANYWRVFNDPNEAAQATAQVFFGIRLLCAKCHDHPFEKWVQTDYYGMAAFFSQVSRKPGRRRDDLVIFMNEAPAQAQHSTTKAMLTPKYLDAEAITVAADQDARARLAAWMTRKDNPFLARAAVNRFWSYLFGRGIIDPVDDIRSSNPPVNAPLLDALAKDFIDHDFDVRHILRAMLNSRTYQLSARTNKTNSSDYLNFSHALPRRLSAEQVLDSLSQATGIRENFRSRFGEQTVGLPAGGVRAGQLPDRQLTAELLDIFGRPRGESTCACERHEEISMTLALHLINGQSVARRLADPNGYVAKLVQKPKISDAEIIDDLYLTVLCRFPAANERLAFERHFGQAGNRLAAAQDAMWVLFNTKEFLFNH